MALPSLSSLLITPSIVFKRTKGGPLA